MHDAEAIYNVLVYIVVIAIFFVAIPLGVRHLWKHRHDAVPTPARKTELLPDAQAELDTVIAPLQAAWQDAALMPWGPPNGQATDRVAVTQSVVLNRTMRGLPSWINPDGTVY